VTLTHTGFGKLFPGLPPAIADLNIGIVALVANIVVLAVVSAATRRAAAAHDRGAVSSWRG
jgi:SSS family solute:Na+ symporter